MSLKKLVAVGMVAIIAMTSAGCSIFGTEEEAVDPKSVTSDISKIDKEALKGSTIHVCTQGGNLVLGEEKKDKDGNTYRDESYAYLKHLSERFTKETGINVELEVVSTEEDLEPLFKVKDSKVDVYTNPNWSLEQWSTYAEPYCTLTEGIELYGDYAKAMPNDGTFIYSIMPAKAYNEGVVYNEEILKSVGYNEVPENLEEFNKLCEALKAKKITPISVHRVENWPLATLDNISRYVAGDANAFEKMLQTDEPFSDSQPYGKTIKMYTEWKAKGYFEQEVYTDFGVAMDSVAYGKAAMMLFGSWVVPQIQGRVPEGKDQKAIKFAPMPDFGSGRFILGAPADNFAISKASKNKEASRVFIEYISEDAQFLADSGFIANKKGVTPVVPELYKIVNDMAEANKCTVLMQPPTDENSTNNQEVLKEANLYADYKYAGMLFDSLDVTKSDDWGAYDKQVEEMNKLYKSYREELGVSWK